MESWTNPEYEELVEQYRLEAKNADDELPPRMFLVNTDPE